MKKIMMMLADSLPEKELLGKLKESIVNYENAVTDSEKKDADSHLQFFLMMVVAKFGFLNPAKEKGESVKDVVEKLDRQLKGAQLLSKEDEPGGKN